MYLNTESTSIESQLKQSYLLFYFILFKLSKLRSWEGPRLHNRPNPPSNNTSAKIPFSHPSSCNLRNVKHTLRNLNPRYLQTFFYPSSSFALYDGLRSLLFGLRNWSHDMALILGSWFGLLWFRRGRDIQKVFHNQHASRAVEFVLEVSPGFVTPFW